MRAVSVDTLDEPSAGSIVADHCSAELPVGDPVPLSFLNRR